MGLTEPFTGFFTDEWERFRAGVERLDPGSAQSVLEAQQRARIPAGDRNIISIPAWDDVIHLRPRYQPTEAERSEYYAARREGRPADLPAGVVTEMDRRANMVRRIRGAPDAETAGSWGRIFTAIDNVQDFMSTLSLFGRLAVWAAPRVLGRLIPGINIIIALGDLLNLLNLMGLVAMPVWTLLCRGPAAALGAGIPGIVFKKALKQHVWATALQSPFARLGRLRFRDSITTDFLAGREVTRVHSVSRTLAPLSRRVLLGRLLEVGQTTDQLYGRGISFGAIVGTVMGTSAGAVAAARGERVRVEFSGGPPPPYQRRRPALPATSTGAQETNRQLQQLINRPLAEDPTADLALLELAGAVMDGAPALLRRPQLWTLDELALIVAAQLEAQRVVYARLRAYDWQEIIAAGADHAWPAPVQLSAASAELARELFPNEPVPLAWDWPGNPGELLLGDYARQAGAEIGPALMARLVPDRQDARAGFIGTIINQAAEEAWWAITRDEEAVAFELAPDWALLANLAEEGRLLAPDPEGTGLQGLWQALLAERHRGGGRPLTPEQIEALAARHGVPVARQLPPDAPWPEEWRAFLEAQAERSSFRPGSR